MALSKSKCWYSNNFFKCAVPFSGQR